MVNHLIARAYDVGFGDCIYVRLPDGDDAYHILIDCGTIAVDPKKPKMQDGLMAALDHIKDELPRAGGEGEQRRLDLLVVTHPHKDHFNGLDPARFRNVRIGQIWLSAFFFDGHPQAQQARAVSLAADHKATALLAGLDRRGLDAGPTLERLLAFRLLDEAAFPDPQGAIARLLENSISNAGALAALKKTGPDETKWLDPTAPRVYLGRDQMMTDPEGAALPGTLRLEPDATGLRMTGFREPDTAIRVLAPEWDIDGHYLDASNPLLGALSGAAPPGALMEPEGDPWPEASKALRNISESDFRRLKSRLNTDAFAFSQADDDLKNDTSIVLLIEWRGRRLLFTGDAEWRTREFRPGKANGSWEVMLARPDLRALLEQGLHYWKVGHHGSINGTPLWADDTHRLVIDKMAPETQTEIVVSTYAGKFDEKNKVPNPDILKEFGRRAATAREYADRGPEPLRTDLERDPSGAPARWVEVKIEGI